MKQKDLGLHLSTRRTRKQILLDEMDLVMPWAELLTLIAPHAPVAKTGRPPFDLAMMLRIHCLQQWFGLSDLGAEEALFETGFYRDFVGISGSERIRAIGEIRAKPATSLTEQRVWLQTAGISRFWFKRAIFCGH